MPFLFNGSRLEIQNPAGVLRLGGAQLFPHLVRVVGMHLGVEAGAVPVALRVIQNRCHRVGHVNDPAGVATYDKQETIGSLQDQVLQLLIRQEGRLVRTVRTGVSCP